MVIDTHTESNSNVIDIGKYINYQFLADATSKGTSTEAFGFIAKGIKDDTLSAERIVICCDLQITESHKTDKSSHSHSSVA